MTDATVEEFEEDLQGVQYVFERLEYLQTEYSEQIAEYARRSPHFNEEFEIYAESTMSGGVFATSPKLERMEELDRPIRSEFECVLKFGYLRGLFAAFTMLDGSTGLPFDEIEPKLDPEDGP